MMYAINNIQQKYFLNRIIERITPRLQHINPCVVLAAIKVIVKYLDYYDIKSDIQLYQSIQNKVAAPLATLISWQQPEIQFTILKNAYYILLKHPQLLDNFQKVFFVKFNEPHYIKQEKLNILISLCNEKNQQIILNELQQYAHEIDPEFVKTCLKAITKIGIQFDSSSKQSVKILNDLFNSAKNTASQIQNEIIICLQQLYRKDPELINCENSLQNVSSSFENLRNSTKAQAAAVWMLGEFAIEIEKNYKILETFINNVLDQERELQLQILTAAVKIYITFPDDSANMIENILTTLTEKCSNADIRDRAYIYWRMLSTDPEKTKQTILFKKPTIEQEENNKISVEFLQCMIDNISKISTVLQQKPEYIFGKEKTFSYKIMPTKEQEKSPIETKDDEIKEQKQNQNQVLPKIKSPSDIQKQAKSLDVDLLGMGEIEQAQQDSKQLDSKQQEPIKKDLLDLLDEDISTADLKQIIQQNQQKNQDQLLI